MESQWPENFDFVALDVETANEDYSSICQVGLAFFKDGECLQTWGTLVDPEDYFSPINVSIHGINHVMVRGAPKIPEALGLLRDHLAGKIIVHHTAYDRVSIKRSAERFAQPEPEFQWLDTARVARRAWEEYRYCGYGLKNLADNFGIEFKHHDAAEDARATGEVLNKAISDSGIALNEWLKKAYKKQYRYQEKINLEGNPDGPFFGETIVFTGALSISRPEAAKLAAEMGCCVGSGVTAKTTLLVVGDQDVRALAGHEKSSKHRKAEDLISKGQELRILTESDFFSLLQLA